MQKTLKKILKKFSKNFQNFQKKFNFHIFLNFEDETVKKFAIWKSFLMGLSLNGGVTTSYDLWSLRKLWFRSLISTPHSSVLQRQYDSCIDAPDLIPLYMLHPEKIWIMVGNVKWLIAPLIFSTTSPSHIHLFKSSCFSHICLTDPDRCANQH